MKKKIPTFETDEAAEEGHVVILKKWLTISY